MSEPMTEMDWTTPEQLARITMEELGVALMRAQVRFLGVGASSDETGERITVNFRDIAGAEHMMALGVPVDEQLGSLYDRSTEHCLSMADLMDGEDDPPEDAVANLIKTGWTWTIHPHRPKGKNGWHVSVEMPQADADQLIVNLNKANVAGGR